jgi:N utilization substance protein A
LSSQITGWKLNVIDKDTAVEQSQEKSETISNILIEKLDVDEDLANTLISNGYNTLESISSSSTEDLSIIEGFDDDISNLLINRAKEVLITLAMEVSTDDGESGDLMSVEGMEMTLALELSQKGINDREDLAEQSIEELTSIIDMSEEDAGELIMRARAHWFED